MNIPKPGDELFIKDIVHNYTGKAVVKEIKTGTILKVELTDSDFVKNVDISLDEWKGIDKMSMNSARQYGYIKGGKRFTHKRKRYAKRKSSHHRRR